MGSGEDDNYPESGEFVLGTVKSLFKQGAFIDLDEYPGKRGMLHLSEISLKWVKNIRDYVKEGQKVVLVVLQTDPRRGHIDLSLRRVNDSQRKEKLQEVKQRQRSEKLAELLAKEVGESKEKVLTKLEEVILSEYETLYAGLDAISADADVANKLKVPAKWAPALADLAAKNIKQPYVEVTRYVSLTSLAPDGVEQIKKTLKKITDYKTDAEIKVSYTSPPYYRVKVKAKTFKKAEKAVKAATDEGISFIQKNKGSGEFYRERPKSS